MPALSEKSGILQADAGTCAAGRGRATAQGGDRL
jgi:hypothetical protein